MISRAIGFCLMPVDNRTCFIVVTPKDLTCRPEIMFATNLFNRTSVALPVERNSGMDRCGLAKLTAAGIAASPPPAAQIFLHLAQADDHRI
jgi:hypothetical protein